MWLRRRRGELGSGFFLFIVVDGNVLFVSLAVSLCFYFRRSELIDQYSGYRLRTTSNWTMSCFGSILMEARLQSVR